MIKLWMDLIVLVDREINIKLSVKNVKTAGNFKIMLLTTSNKFQEWCNQFFFLPCTIISKVQKPVFQCPEHYQKVFKYDCQLANRKAPGKRKRRFSFKKEKQFNKEQFTQPNAPSAKQKFRNKNKQIYTNVSYDQNFSTFGINI